MALSTRSWPHDWTSTACSVSKSPPVRARPPPISIDAETGPEQAGQFSSIATMTTIPPESRRSLYTGSPVRLEVPSEGAVGQAEDRRYPFRGAPVEGRRGQLTDDRTVLEAVAGPPSQQ